MQKKEIRAAFRQKRMDLTQPAVTRMEDLLLIRAQRAGWRPVTLLMGYMADISRNEPDPTNIMRWLRFMSPGMQEVMPRIHTSDGDMDAVIFEEGQSLTWNPFGIAEPAGGQEVDPAGKDIISKHLPARSLIHI